MSAVCASKIASLSRVLRFSIAFATNFNRSGESSSKNAQSFIKVRKQCFCKLAEQIG